MQQLARDLESDPSGTHTQDATRVSAVRSLRFYTGNKHDVPRVYGVNARVRCMSLTRVTKFEGDKTEEGLTLT